MFRKSQPTELQLYKDFDCAPKDPWNQAPSCKFGGININIR
jgi:hypothetical protein